MTSRSSKLAIKGGVSNSVSFPVNDEIQKINTDLQFLAQRIAEMNGTPVPTPSVNVASSAGSSPFVTGLRSIAGTTDVS